MDEPAALSPGPGSAAWRGLGSAGGLRLTAAELLRVELPFRRPVVTSAGTHRRRPLVLVHLVCLDEDGTVVDGWGECAALADTTYDAEDADAAWATLATDLLPAVVGDARRRGSLVAVGGLPETADPSGRPLAWSALEMAVGDAWLRWAGRSLAGLLAVGGARVAPGAVLGLPTTTEGLRADLDRLRDEGYARAKVKLAPGVETLLTTALAGRRGDRPSVQVDANGAYGPATVAGLHALDGLGLLCIEQPLGRDDLAGHRDLAASLTTPVCLDESLDSPARVAEAVSGGACSVVCVKPARLGGIGAALDVVDWCRRRAVPWWMGGMFESGFARRVLVTLAALPGPGLPGDLAPPSTYLVGDVVGPMTTTRDPDSGHLELAVHEGPGVAPAPHGLGAVLVRRSPVAVADT